MNQATDLGCQRNKGRCIRAACWAACLLILGLAAGDVPEDEGEPPNRELARREAVILWIGLGILSVSVVGIGLIWGVSRARRLLRKRESAHTEMTNIWYLNPPGKRRQDDS